MPADVTDACSGPEIRKVIVKTAVRKGSEGEGAGSPGGASRTWMGDTTRTETEGLGKGGRATDTDGNRLGQAAYERRPFRLRSGL